MTSPGEWYASLPPISKTFGTVLFGSTLATTLQLIDPSTLYLSFPLVFSKFQVWRLLSCFFWAGPFKFPFVFKLLMIFQCGVSLERDAYQGRPADFLFLFIFGMFSMLPCTLIPFFSLPFLNHSLIILLVYVWSRQNANQQMNIYGLFSVPAFYFPFLLLFMDLVMGANPCETLLGIVVGHLYHFLTAVYPQQSGHTILTTPQWVHWLVAKWAQSAPDMFPPEAARIPPPPSDTQRMYLRRPGAGAGPTGGAPGTGAGGAAPSGPAPQAQPTASSSTQAFRGRSYRLDRD